MIWAQYLSGRQNLFIEVWTGDLKIPNTRLWNFILTSVWEWTLIAINAVILLFFLYSMKFQWISGILWCLILILTGCAPKRWSKHTIHYLLWVPLSVPHRIGGYGANRTPWLEEEVMVSESTEHTPMFGIRGVIETGWANTKAIKFNLKNKVG